MKYEESDPSYFLLDIRAFLPQIRHLRLRVESSCSQSVCDLNDSNATEAANLGTFIVSQFRRGGMNASYRPYKDCALRCEFFTEEYAALIPALVFSMVSL